MQTNMISTILLTLLAASPLVQAQQSGAAQANGGLQPGGGGAQNTGGDSSAGGHIGGGSGGGVQYAGVNVAGFDFGCETDVSLPSSAAPPLQHSITQFLTSHALTQPVLFPRNDIIFTHPSFGKFTPSHSHYPPISYLSSHSHSTNLTLSGFLRYLEDLRASEGGTQWWWRRRSANDTLHVHVQNEHLPSAGSMAIPHPHPRRGLQRTKPRAVRPASVRVRENGRHVYHRRAQLCALERCDYRAGRAVGRGFCAAVGGTGEEVPGCRVWAGQ